jgi:hypothetical protein
VLKFAFSIVTREGQKVSRIVIAGRDQADAERKLLQMYRNCTVIECESQVPSRRPGFAVAAQDPFSPLPS